MLLNVPLNSSVLGLAIAYMPELFTLRVYVHHVLKSYMVWGSICIRIALRICVCVYVYVLWESVCVRVCVCACVCIYTHTYIHTHIYVWVLGVCGYGTVNSDFGSEISYYRQILYILCLPWRP